MADLNSTCDKCSNAARWRCRKTAERQVRRLCGSCFLALMAEEELTEVQPLRAPWRAPTAQPVKAPVPLTAVPPPTYPAYAAFTRVLERLPAGGFIEIEDLFAWLLADEEEEA